MAERKRRDFKEDDSSAPSTKRTRYDYDRDFYSLPQYNKPIYHHRYDLRSIEHRKPVDYYSSQSSEVKTKITATTTKQMCTRSSTQSTHPLVTRNAHSYSINALATRCSNSSTASGQRRKRPALKKEVGNAAPTTSLANLRPRRKRKITQDEDVSWLIS